MLTVQELEDALTLLFDLQVKVGAVAQHGPLVLALLQQAEDPQGQVQDVTHPGLDGTRSKVHGHRLNNVHLTQDRRDETTKVEVVMNQ